MFVFAIFFINDMWANSLAYEVCDMDVGWKLSLFALRIGQV